MGENVVWLTLLGAVLGGIYGLVLSIKKKKK